MLGDVPRGLDAEVMVGRIAGLIKAESSAILSDRNSVGVRDGKLFPPHAYASYVEAVAASPVLYLEC